MALGAHKMRLQKGNISEDKAIQANINIQSTRKSEVDNRKLELTISNRSRQFISFGRNLLKECRIILSV